MRAESQHFYVWIVGAFILVAFGGYMPIFWAPVVVGTFHAPPVIHTDGMLMLSWVCFYFVQMTLAASGRTLDHRSCGMAGIALFSVIACAIPVGEMAGIKRDEAVGMGDEARRFAAVTLCGWPLMVGLFAMAIANTRRPQVHKRLMTLLMVSMMTRQRLFTPCQKHATSWTPRRHVCMSR